MYKSIDLINKTYSHHFPDIFNSADIRTAEIINRHVLLTAGQLKYFDVPRHRLSHMVKYGWLYRYKLHNDDDGKFLSIYTIGPSARHYLGYPVIGLGRSAKAYSMVLVNHVLIYLINNVSDIRITISYQKHVQAAFEINNPTGIYAPEGGFDHNVLSIEGLDQAVVILKDRSYARPDLPVRYVFVETHKIDPMELKFYAYNSHGIVETELLPS